MRSLIGLLFLVLLLVAMLRGKSSAHCPPGCEVGVPVPTPAPAVFREQARQVLVAVQSWKFTSAPGAAPRWTVRFRDPVTRQAFELSLTYPAALR